MGFHFRRISELSLERDTKKNKIEKEARCFKAPIFDRSPPSHARIAAMEEVVIAIANELLGQIPGIHVPPLPSSSKRRWPKGIEHMQVYPDIAGHIGEYRKVKKLFRSFRPHPESFVLFAEQHLRTAARVRYQVGFLAIANLENDCVALFTREFSYPRSQKGARRALLRAEKGIAEVRSFFPECRSSLSVPDLRMPIMASALIENPDACIDAQAAWRRAPPSAATAAHRRRREEYI